MTRYEKLEAFKAWLRATSKIYTDANLSAWLDEIETHYASTGSCFYELPSRETYSGNSECYRFSVKDVYYFDGDQLTQEQVDNGADYDDFARVFVF